MNHKIKSLYFGNRENQKVIKKLFGEVDDGAHTMFNMFNVGKVKHDLKFEAEKEPQLYFYFVKLVPHVFIDMYQYREWRSYSYSLAHNKKASDNAQMLGLTIILDYAPVKMILTKEPREFGQFAINLCSIIGGVFIMGGLLNSFFLSLCFKCCKKQ
jgi:hypothetical protein